jgi:hypothetical protein
MMDWTNNQPNARFWVLKLIKDNFSAGDKLVETTADSHDISAQAFVTPAGRKLLIVNKRNRVVDIALSDAATAHGFTVDEQSLDGPARNLPVANGAIQIQPFAVTVVSW